MLSPGDVATPSASRGFSGRLCSTTAASVAASGKQRRRSHEREVLHGTSELWR